MKGTTTALLVILVLTTLLLAPSTASADWFWNAQLKVEGTPVQLKWKVNNNDAGKALLGDEDRYRADIRFSHPKEANVMVVSTTTPNEKVQLNPSAALSITTQGVQFKATFRVVDLKEAVGDEVLVWVYANGKLVASGSGHLKDDIVLSGVIPKS